VKPSATDKLVGELLSAAAICCVWLTISNREYQVVCRKWLEKLLRTMGCKRKAKSEQFVV